jgi:hypothetical protein
MPQDTVDDAVVCNKDTMRMRPARANRVRLEDFYLSSPRTAGFAEQSELSRSEGLPAGKPAVHICDAPMVE